MRPASNGNGHRFTRANFKHFLMPTLIIRMTKPYEISLRQKESIFTACVDVIHYAIVTWFTGVCKVCGMGKYNPNKMARRDKVAKRGRGGGVCKVCGRNHGPLSAHCMLTATEEAICGQAKPV
jgi:hypothetical protein